MLHLGCLLILSVVAVNLVWNRLLGDVPCSQLTPGISADESRDFSLTLLVDPVRGDTLARAAEHRRSTLQTIYPTPSPRPEPGVHSSPQTRSDLLPARPYYNGDEKR